MSARRILRLLRPLECEVRRGTTPFEKLTGPAGLPVRAQPPLKQWFLPGLVDESALREMVGDEIVNTLIAGGELVPDADGPTPPMVEWVRLTPLQMINLGLVHTEKTHTIIFLGGNEPQHKVICDSTGGITFVPGTASGAIKDDARVVCAYCDTELNSGRTITTTATRIPKEDTNA